ncbi:MULTISPECIES: type IV pilin-like G/H family protein [unclassified Tolypothrix]|uniref:type IV pilin-like G/H family protein n=1 Tax=unclassified Tolypothrix TaxID=2649714 RepID=UPI0005F7A998|nr:MULTISPECIES: type IV pilin-like G/H family protein [unclassified Tolypothrix]MBE9081797.1 type IV pilin-like G/H family protein [Tolypothrix sp. LEGE 11397]UYD27788.1 type IV pilin-like G/H family protein [Tolypothrix sp. PCC 7712]UYD36348.1 type IV pilin-like G/H family protein [Tolypothrix sp. PCC 7601]
MKTELKAKFLQHILGKKKEGEGFTLIELLVVIIIIGILSAIALPSFLNQAKKAKQSEAKTYVGSMNRGQQAYMTENDAFTASIDSMGIGIASQTANYKFTAVTGDNSGLAYAINDSSLVTSSSGLKNYGGHVYLKKIGANSELTSVAYLCETNNVGPRGSATITAGGTTCDSDGKLIK